MWIRRVPRRQIAIAAVVSGIAAGALLTFGMTQLRSSPTPIAAAPEAPPAAPAETPPPTSTPTVFIDELAATPTPNATPSASTEAGAASAVPSSSVSSGKVVAPGRTPSRATPAARTPPKKAAKGRDYGI
jgi:hypothetical protein